MDNIKRIGLLQNKRHEAFAMQIAEGKTFTEAAINCGYSVKNARFRGSKLAAMAHIKARIEELRARGNEKAVTATGLTRAYILEKLHENMKRAMEIDDGAVANRALELIGKELGMFVDQKKIQVGRLSDATPEQLLQLLGEIDDEISRARKVEPVQ